MKAGAGKLVSGWLGYAWLCGLAVALAISALYADRRARQVAEYPCCCDPFGYLQMAQDIRRARMTSSRPEFTIESPHTRLLIDLMKSRNVPPPLWVDLVAPLAYHYFPESDHVGVQYPPGVGLMFALFPEGKALRRLNLLVVVAFLVTGLIILFVAALRHSWYSAGLLILSLDLGLEMLGIIDNASFSINAMLIPLLLCGVCLLSAFGMADNSQSQQRSYFLVLLAGLFFGLAILVRLPVVLLMPGLLLLLLPGKWRSWYKSAGLAFILGTVLGGFVPLALHQSRVSGAWYLSTYPSYDTSPPNLGAFWPNVYYYFGPGKGSSFIWIWPVAFIGCAGLFFLSVHGKRSQAPPTGFLRELTWIRLIVSILLIWGFSLAYFLTHPITNHVYQMPATFCAVLMLALGSFRLESRRSGINNEDRRRGITGIAMAFALLPGLVVLDRAWSNYHPPSQESKQPSFSLPAELADERAWVWTSFLSGTVWYYVRKPAHKISSSDPDTRAIVFEFVRDRGEPQFIIGDDPGMKPVEEEIVQLGGKLELRGEVHGYSYYLIHWPLNGPLKAKLNAFNNRVWPVDSEDYFRHNTR